MKIVLDTDIGNDCDDAGAIALLCNLKKEYNFDILAIGSSTPLVEGAKAVDSITTYYNCNCLIGYSSLKPDYFNPTKKIYSQVVAEEYKHLKSNKIGDYVKSFRKVFAESDEKITLIIIGPFNAFVEFINSKADEISSLTGKELINNKVEHIYIMGGTFCKEPEIFAGNPIYSEWNIKVDIKSAQYFLKNITCPMTFVPFETGLLFTGENLKDMENPVTRSYQYYSNGTRYSWDPITAYYAITKDNKNFVLSDLGTISIDDNGVSKITYNKLGKHRILNIKSSKEEIKKIINKYLY